MNGPIIGYVRICVDPLGGGPRGQFGPILGPKNVFFINYIRIMLFMWDLGLMSSDSPKDVVYGKILVFCNNLCFPWVNWTLKWTKTQNFGYVLFPLKHITYIHNTFIHCLCLIMFYSWSKFQQNQVWIGGERAQKPPKMNHFMDAPLPRKHLKFYNLETRNAIKMKLTMIMYLHDTFHLW